MRKTFTLAFAALALTAAAATPKQELMRTTLRNAAKTVSAVPGKTHAGIQSASPTAKTEPEHEWVGMGEGTMFDDITVSYFFEVQPGNIQVEVEKDAANEGWYRVVNPWKNFTQTATVTAAGGTLEQTDDVVIVIDASNPEYVRLLENNIGMDDGYGASTLVGFTELAGENLGIGGDITQEEADARAGKMEDGVITFPVKNSLMFRQGTDFYNANSEGRVSLSLPGNDMPVDYTVKSLSTSRFCPEDDGCYHVEFSGDSRIAGVKWIKDKEYPEGDAAVNALIGRLKNEGQVVPINSGIKVDISDATGPEYFIFFAPVDDEGNLADEQPYYMAFWVPDTDTEGWTTIGNANMTEGFLSCLLPDKFTPESYKVEVQRNIANPGLYRIAEPYNPWTQGAAFVVNHDHTHYIYFNAENHNNVYIMESGLGLSLANMGETGVGSGYYDMVREYGLDFLAWLDIVSGGTIADNVLTFDGTNEIKIYLAGTGRWYFTNVKPNPDFVEGTSPEEERYLGGDFKLDMTGLDLSGIADIEADGADGEAEYFNLQGMRVQHPEAGSIYICRKGGKSFKTMVR